MTTNDRPLCDDSATVRPSPALIQAARLRVTINDRRGVETDPEIRALAMSGPGAWRPVHQ
jgi:hypothetical protein